MQSAAFSAIEVELMKKYLERQYEGNAYDCEFRPFNAPIGRISKEQSLAGLNESGAEEIAGVEPLQDRSGLKLWEAAPASGHCRSKFTNLTHLSCTHLRSAHCPKSPCLPAEATS